MSSQIDNHPARQVLFVDQEPDFLRTVRETFGSLSAGRWQIHCAGATDAALEQLQQQQMDLVAVNTSLPLLDGIQFLSLLDKRYPGLKKVSFALAATDETRAACLDAGAELFIEKPKSPEAFESVFAMLEDLLNWVPQRGFQGMLRSVGLQDVIQMECLSHNSSVLEVYNDHVVGRIYIEEGNLIHAAGGELTGERALQRLLALPGGSFELIPFEPPYQKTISGPWESLLAAATRANDLLAAPGLPGEPEVDPETLAAPAAVPVQVVETLICSALGKPLYEVDCADVPGRVLLLKSIARCAAQLAQTAPLGNFDRLEIQLAAGRAIVQARPDRLVFVAVANHQPPSP